MNIVICGSISKGNLLEASELVKKMFPDASIVTPLDSCVSDYDELSLFDKQRRYVEALNEADLVIIVPKRVTYKGINDTPNGGTSMVYNIGESTSYEYAMAKQFGIPTVLWTTQVPRG